MLGVAMAWTPERIEELTQLWNAGHSASVIGKRLGVSKNAVVGKAHRLKLPARPSPIRRQAKPQAPVRKPAPALTRPTAEPVAVTPQPPVVVAEEARPPQPMIRTGQQPSPRKCQWPIGDPTKPDFHFCGEAAVPSKPYCAEHCAVAYVIKARDRRSEAA